MNIFKLFQGKKSNNEDWANDDYEEDEYDAFGVPVGCSACGGDYPNCKDSCPMFDD